MKYIKNKLNQVLEFILIIVLGVMVLNVSWQVFSRYVLANPSSFTDELARYLMIWLGVMGTAYVSGKRLHVSIDFFPSQLNLSLQKTMEKNYNFNNHFSNFFDFYIWGVKTCISNLYTRSKNLPHYRYHSILFICVSL